MINKLPNFKDSQGRILVPISEASKILGVSVDTLRRWDEKGKIVSRRPDGKNRYFALQDIENFKASKTFSIGEAAEFLGISHTTLRRLDERGILPAERVGAERVYRLPELEEFSSSQYFQTKKNLERLEKDVEVAEAKTVEVHSSEKDRVDQIVRIINEDENDLDSLVSWRSRLAKGAVLAVLICLIIVFGVTSSFLVAPIKTAQFMGFVDSNGNKLIASPNVSIAGSNSYDVLGASSTLTVISEPKYEQPGAAKSLIRSVLLPFTRVSLAIIDVVDHKKYEKVIPRNINEIFAFNKKNELVPLTPIDFATSDLLKVGDKGLIKNLNADYLRGRVPGTGPGNLVYYNSKGEIEGYTEDTYYVTQPFTGILPLANGGTGANLTLANNGGLIFLSGNKLNSTGPQNGVIIASGSGAFGAVAGTPNYLIKWNSSGNSLSSQSMIYDNGSVGIGNTDPGQALDVSGNIYARGGQIRIGNFAAPPGAIGAGSLYYDTGSNQVFYFNGTNWQAFGTGSGGDSVWTTGTGVIYPTNLTVDALIGGTSSASAKFGFVNVLAGTPSIQINGTTVLDPSTLGSGVVTSSLTSVGALTSGSIASGFGTISTTNTITGTTVNGTTGVNTGAGAGTQRIDASGNLVNIGTITSGLINGQNISNAANFTGSLTAVGPITFTTFNTNGGLLYTNGTGTLAQTSAGMGGECLISNGGGAPMWGSCGTGGAGSSYWNLANGTLYPINQTLDLLVGGSSTTSAKFALIGSSQARGLQIASVSGGLTLDSSTNSIIQTTNNRTLTINPNGGRVGIGTSAPRYELEVVGNRTTAEAISVKNLSNSTAASADVFVWNDIDAYTDFGMSSSTYTTIPALQNFGYFYTSGNANGFSIYNEGADPIMFAVNSTEVARFDTTGQLNLGGDTTPNALFTVGNASQFQVNSSGAIAAATGITSSGTVTFSGFSGANNGGVIFANSSGVLFQTSAGTSAQCLLGGATPTFGSCSTGGTDSPFQVLNGAIVPLNSTLDFLVGGQATTSADFAFIRVNSGTPTASISAGTTNNNTFLTGAGNLATTNGQTLTLGGSSTGLIQVSNKAGSVFSTFDTVNSRLGIGTATPTDTLDVAGTARILSGSNGSVQSLLMLRNNGGTSVGTGVAVDFYAGDTNIRGKLTGVVESGGSMALVYGNGVGSTTERFRIDKFGNVGIGSSTPTSALYVTKPLSFGASGKALAVLDQIEQQDIFTASSAGTTRFVINNAGAVGIKTTSLPSESNLVIGSNSTTEGGQIQLNPGSSGTVAYFLDTYNDTFRILRGSTTASSANVLVADQNTLTLSSQATLTASSLATIDWASTVGIDSTTVNLGNGLAAIIGTTSNANLTINPNGSGILNLNNSGTGATNIGTSTNTGAVAIGNSTGGLTITPTAWTATPTISGLITATSGLTSTGTLTANGTLDANGIVNLGDGADALTIASTGLDVTSAGAVSGVTTLSMGGALTGVTTITTSGAINSQTISSAANFTGTLTVASTLTANGTLDANGIVNLGDGADALTIASTGLDVTSAGAVSGVTTLSMGGALTGVTTITTSGAINSQTISSAANFTGTLTVAGTGTALTLSGASTTALDISNSGVTTDIALQNNETISNNTDGLIQLSGAIGSDFNFNGGSGTFPSTQGFTIGWNYSSGGGEVDLISRRGAGSTGGFRIYDWNGTTATNIFDITGAGALTVAGNVDSASFSTSNWSIDQSASCGGTGRLCFEYSGGAQVSFTTGGQGRATNGFVTGTPDYAENITVSDSSIESGDIVTSVIYDSNEENVYRRSIASKSDKEYQGEIIGAISENPGFLAAQANLASIPDKGWNDNERPLTVAGRIPLKVSTINGPIKVGDRITSSNIPGVGMKSTEAGQIVGIAMEPYNNSDTGVVGKILVFIKPGFYDPDVYITSTGDISVMFDPATSLGIVKNNGKTVKRNSVNNEGVFGKLRAGIIEVTTITTDSLNIKTDEVRIGDKTLAQYIDDRAGAGGASLETEAKLASLQSQVDSLNSVLGVATGSAEINLLTSQINDTESQIEALEATQSASATSENGSFNKLKVSGNTLIEGILTVVDPLKATDLIVTGTASFFDDVVFKGKVRFDNNVQFASNAAGAASISQGNKKAKVTFTKKFDSEPLVNATMIVEGADSEKQAILSAGYVVAVTDKSDTGFTIILNKVAGQDLKFNWSAVQVGN